jgi:hypothetical protein
MHMTTKLILILTILSALIACQNKPSETNKQISSTEQVGSTKHIGTTERSCYAYTKNRDTIFLSINTRELQVNGTLRYNLYEKDRNSGKVTGKMIGDTLLLNYSFASEGTQSVRQLAFLKKGDSLIEGYADVQEKEGIVMFKKPTDLKFDGSIIMKKTDCRVD